MRRLSAWSSEQKKDTKGGGGGEELKRWLCKGAANSLTNKRKVQEKGFKRRYV